MRAVLNVDRNVERLAHAREFPASEPARSRCLTPRDTEHAPARLRGGRAERRGQTCGSIPGRRDSHDDRAVLWHDGSRPRTNSTRSIRENRPRDPAAPAPVGSGTAPPGGRKRFASVLAAARTLHLCPDRADGRGRSSASGAPRSPARLDRGRRSATDTGSASPRRSPSSQRPRATCATRRCCRARCGCVPRRRAGPIRSTVRAAIRPRRQRLRRKTSATRVRRTSSLPAPGRSRSARPRHPFVGAAHAVRLAHCVREAAR